MADDQTRALHLGTTEAARRLALLRPHLDGDAPLARVAADAGVPLRTARRWLARFREDGPAGLARPLRSDAGRSRASLSS